MIANLLTIHDVVTANISQSFANKVAARTAGIDLEHNYITVTLCIQGGLERPLATFAQKGGKCFPHVMCGDYYAACHRGHTAIRPSVCPSPRQAPALGYRHAGCLQLSHVRTADGRRFAASRTAIGGRHIVSPPPGR